MSTTKVDFINTFKLPIEYSSSPVKLSDSIVDDLELIKTADLSLSPMYSIIMRPSTNFGKEGASRFSEYYTNDVPFLKDTQTLLKTYQHQEQPTDICDDASALWSELKAETGFCEKYLYIDWEMGKFLNTNSSFLQMMSIYNITSPIISFCLPIIILIVPFFIINARGLPLTTAEYVAILQKIMENHAIGKLFIDFESVSLSQKAYILCSTALYLFSIYQNIMVCFRFYKNIIKINQSLLTLQTYISHSINTFDSYLSQSNKLTNYKTFNECVMKNRDSLVEYKNKLHTLGTFDFSWENIVNIGDRMQFFYHIYDSNECHQIMMYSFGLHGYLDNINGLIKNISENKLNYANITNKKGIKTVMTNSYYPALMNDATHVNNTCNLTKNMVLSGPNASGKTTVLKSALCNIILTQQFGCGCYETANITPYKFIHCYLNIPDTSGRDSLFQAEARRCKDIIDLIAENPDDTHFCTFDELYSGTNPEDAVASSIAFMQYLSEQKNVSCILTTHYNKVCRKLGKTSRMRNYSMKTIETGPNEFKYTYKLVKGISNIKGGVKVLQELNYPSIIVKNTQNYGVI